ncbi:hypothetical protein L211DRAFT_840606 [Terfezia boudieri ATCC MYA-4762]|uniref:Uncharacterized protein n=1 Tax=Terfezia boudieri ATCC MYA-4762 TaxID=1051890 RepID=A0A3N4LEU2_9PEZI|nr:hypothetical protein L211DRAFT_840606 [Terfezia boudieri ATCC MYA-4762]
MLYGFSTFFPTIIKSTSLSTAWTTPQIQALTIPCYLLGARVDSGAYQTDVQIYHVIGDIKRYFSQSTW